YLFGTDFIVAPYTEPLDRKIGMATQTVWLPPGDWYHFLNGRRYSGDAWYTMPGRLDDIPVFVRAGAIVPLGPRVGWGGVENPDELHLHFYAGADGRFVLFEDDGVSLSYRDGSCALAQYEQYWRDGQIDITIMPAGGDPAITPAQRTYYLYLHGVTEPEQVVARVNGAPYPVSVDRSYGGEGVRLTSIILERTAVAEIVLRTT
ncbi:MAG TPA: DUF5110 domain-containing protein, partial [Promineifilum sp.]|nr:DUF5110 domain-containing protein [Promineifilum sp.]